MCLLLITCAFSLVIFGYVLGHNHRHVSSIEIHEEQNNYHVKIINEYKELLYKKNQIINDLKESLIKKANQLLQYENNDNPHRQRRISYTD